RDKLVTGVQTCALPICPSSVPGGWFPEEIEADGPLERRAAEDLARHQPSRWVEVQPLHVTPQARHDSVAVVSAPATEPDTVGHRSEERRVGKECKAGRA